MKRLLSLFVPTSRPLAWVAWLTVMVMFIGCGRSEITSDDRVSLETTALEDQAVSESDTGAASDPNEGAKEAAEELTVGDKAPDFTVEVTGGESVTLSQYFGTSAGPTILLFNRAHW